MSCHCYGEYLHLLRPRQTLAPDPKAKKYLSEEIVSLVSSGTELMTATHIRSIGSYPAIRPKDICVRAKDGFIPVDYPKIDPNNSLQSISIRERAETKITCSFGDVSTTNLDTSLGRHPR